MIAVVAPAVEASLQTAPRVAEAMLGLPEMLVILAIVVVLFGATKLPQLGRGLGEAIGNFKKAQRDAIRDADDAGDREEIDATPALRDGGADQVEGKFESRKQSDKV